MKIYFTPKNTIRIWSIQANIFIGILTYVYAQSYEIVSVDVNIEYVNRVNIDAKYNQLPKNECSITNTNEFMRKYIGGQTCGNDYKFEFNLPPHYQRNIMVDMIFMNDNKEQKVSIDFVDTQKTPQTIQMSGKETRMQSNCQDTTVDKEKDLDQMYRGSWKQKNRPGTNLQIIFNESCTYYWAFKQWTDDKLKNLKIGTIQLNISQCDPSCLTCQDYATNCITCSESKAGNTCSCKDSSMFLHKGVCVKNCPQQEFYFPFNKKCIYLNGCTRINSIKGICSSCNSNLFLFEGSCITKCPCGFSNIIDGNICSDQNNIPDEYFMKGALSSHDFSQLTVDYLGIKMTQYYQSDESSSQVSLCGELQLLGGFFINQKGTIITFPKYTTTKKFVQIQFTYVLIDMPNSAQKANPQIVVNLGSAQQAIDASSSISQNICGFEDNEWVGVFTHTFNVQAVDQSNLQIVITNNNVLSVQGSNADTPNQHPYFGIREISIVAFNCQQKNCIECNSMKCQKCQIGYFLDLMTSDCLMCTNKICKECDGGGIACISCIDPNMAIQSGSCQCNSNYYLSWQDKSCFKCFDQYCDKCSGGNNQECTQCVSGKYLKVLDDNSTQCTDCNEEGYFKENITNRCKKCFQNCKICTGSEKENCKECIQGYALDMENNCIVCPRDLYFIQNQYCLQCHSDCQQCNGSLQSQCTLCKGNLYLQDNFCQNCDLTKGYYIEGPNCKKCDQSCTQCSSQQKDGCKVCASGLIFTERDNKKYCETCDIINESKFIDSSNICRTCHSDCQKCDGLEKNNCLTCKEGWFMFEDKSCNQQCKIDEGMFIDKLNPTNCNKCHSTCKKCSGQLSTDCLECKSGLYLKEDSSCDDCKNPFFYIDDQRCLPCHQSCGSCKGKDITDCITCQTGLVIFEQKCIKCDGNGVYLNSQNICLKCSEDCQQCNENGCLLCSNNKFIDESSQKCVKCEDIVDHYNDGKYCRKCNEVCVGCIGGSEKDCKKCALNYFKIDKSSPNTCSLCPQTSLVQSYSPSNNCEECDWECTQCSSQSSFCKLCNCKKCYKDYINYNGKCISSCSKLGFNYEFNAMLGICQCRNGYIYEVQPQYLNEGEKQVMGYCSQDIPIGYYCNSLGICKECSKDSSCFTCSSQDQCLICINGFYLWEGQCSKECHPSLNIVPSNKKGLCECREDYIYINKEDSPFYTSQNYCDSQLETISFELENILISSSSNAQSLFKQFQNNVITIKMNRQPTKKELLNYSFEISDTTLIKDKDYKISKVIFNGNLIQLDIEAEENYKIKQISMTLNQMKEVIDFPQTVLVSKEYVKSNENSEQKTKQISKTMENMSQALTVSSNKGVQVVLDFLKTFQLLCYTSNFVQLLAPIYLIKDNLPPQARYGTILGASFVFTTIPPPQQLSFKSSDKTNNNDDSSNFENTQRKQILQAFGLDSYLYSNFIFVQLVIVIISMVILLCLIARHLMLGKQYTLTIVDRLSNFLASYIQGSITISLFAITLTIYHPIHRYLGIFQVLCNIFFLIELFYLYKSRSNEYLNTHVPNFFQNINFQAKGSKSYLLVSLVKKYLVIILMLTMSNSPYTCTIIIGVIFNLCGLYILYFRFFQNRVINYIKILQEFIISTLFFIIAASIKKKEESMKNDIISDSDLNSIQNYGKIILIFFLVCLIISFSLFVIRLFLSVQNLIQTIQQKRQEQKRKKEEMELMFDFSRYQIKNLESNFKSNNTQGHNESAISIQLSNSFVRKKLNQPPSLTDLD